MSEDMDWREVASVCLNEIIRLKTENEEQKKQIEHILQIEKRLLSFMKEDGTRNLKYEWNDPKTDKSIFWYPKFYMVEETVEMIVRDRKSMARFGDGELALMAGKEKCRFQRFDEKLARRLEEVIRFDEDGFLIAIPDIYGSLDDYQQEDRYGLRLYMTETTRKEHLQFLNLDRTYHNTFISRPYAVYADNGTAAPKQRFENLKRIWQGRDLILVEGALTRQGAGNDLFAGAPSIRWIEAPPVNSFDRYDEILAASLRYAEENSLFLIAMGPSAGVLAFDLYHAGYQALDIGHLDLEYEWYLRGRGGRCPVEYKYNNEVSGGDQVADFYDEAYLSQIIYVAGA